MTKLSNRRSRLVDGYEMGSIDPTDFRKRVASIDAERNAINLQLEATEPPEIDESACIDLAYAFARWSRSGALGVESHLNRSVCGSGLKRKDAAFMRV